MPIFGVIVGKDMVSLNSRTKRTPNMQLKNSMINTWMGVMCECMKTVAASKQVPREALPLAGVEVEVGAEAEVVVRKRVKNRVKRVGVPVPIDQINERNEVPVVIAMMTVKRKKRNESMKRTKIKMKRLLPHRLLLEHKHHSTLDLYLESYATNSCVTKLDDLLRFAFCLARDVQASF